MLFYFIKSGACLAILLVFYKFFLEKEGIHTFKRYYLLTAVIISFVIPLITFTQYIEVSEGATPVFTGAMSFDEDASSLSTVSYWPAVLWSIYGIGVLFFYLRFLVRVKGIINRIKQNPVKQYAIYTNVLHNDKLAPHTFLKYIFLNGDDYHQNNIPDEVLLHEKAHARQQHSLDIIFLEVLQIICWFNPLIYWAKRHIKLNHEFLADREVLNHGVHSSTYQELLLAFSSGAKHTGLSSAINYSSIKKRFTVMKKQTSNFTWLKSALLLPLLAILIYSFSEKETQITHNQSDVIVLTMPNDNEIEFQESTFTLKTIEQKLSSNIERGEVHIEYGPEVSVEACNSLHNLLITLGFPTIKEYTIGTNGILMKEMYNHLLEANTPEEALREYNSLVKHYNTFKLEKGMDLIDISKIQHLYEKLTAEQKKSAEPYPDLSSFKNSKKLITTIQQGASKKMTEEYNKLARKYKNANSGTIKIDKKEVERMYYIYGIMTEAQKKEAEPYPNFPPPPPGSSNTANYSKSRSKFLAYVTPKGAWPQVYLSLPEDEAKVAKKLYDRMIEAYYQLSAEEKSNQEKLPPPPPPARKHKQVKEEIIEVIEVPAPPAPPRPKEPVVIEVVEERASEVVEVREVIEVVEVPVETENTPKKVIQVMEVEGAVPPPPPPPNPEEHMKELAKQNATFYFNGSKISAKKAIELVKSKKAINISVLKGNEGIPTVKLTDQPIEH
ncbi:M56 family metallopeptidase [Zhouia amylolytica]|uniref:M56 family metallopeptidase n=1 Tax=Zhouia amylolytica TaxID=376730 RepID=UPI0020CDAFBE|nr:M56 family metallopeptidase [Zhouia amylolytica]MCQ0110295.1 M56 family metallopeptidase [Zhouia amylolytica]